MFIHAEQGAKPMRQVVERTDDRLFVLVDGKKVLLHLVDGQFQRGVFEVDQYFGGPHQVISDARR